jgi:hypothetical protein
MGLLEKKENGYRAKKEIIQAFLPFKAVDKIVSDKDGGNSSGPTEV